MSSTRRPFAFVTKQGKVVRSEVMDRFAVKESAQAQDSFHGMDLGAKGLIEPPYSPDGLIKLLEVNTYHSRACRVKSQDVAGRGWRLEPASTSVDSESSEAVARRAVVEDWLGSIDNLGSVLTAAQMDYETLGWGAVEVTFGTGKMPVNLYHIPARTLRLHKSKERWMQKRGNKHVWFRDIAKDVPVNQVTGEKEGAKASASAVMVWQLQHPVSDYYGVPDIIPAVGAIVGDTSRRDYNISFFNNYGVPAYAVFITGDFDPGEPRLMEGDEPGNPTGPTPLEESIEEHFKVLAENPHSVMVLTIPTTVGDDFGGDGGKVGVEIKPLSVEAKEASFRMYRQDNRDEVLSAHGVDPYRVGIAEVGSLGGGTAEQATEIYKESVIEPRQQQIEALINKYIIQELLGVYEWVFRLNELDTTSAIEDLQILTGLFTMGAVTPRQIAERFANRFGLDMSGMDHPALNAHYIAGSPVDLAMADAQEVPAEQVVAALQSLHATVFGLATKSDGIVGRAEFNAVKSALNRLAGVES